MTAQTTTPEDRNLDDLFNTITELDEIWAVFGRNGIAFRFGPFSKNEVAGLVDKAREHSAGMMITMNSGKVIPWEQMAEVSPADWPEIEDEQ